MKTNQEMIRYIGQYSVIQRTSDGFLTLIAICIVLMVTLIAIRILMNM